ncbi:hypothetical protein BDY17DRAFT_60487 [Neohortaea acidophila]|uniref:Secreted protein n=1 Tax=Neohortaea acidophila TaxID=245834 RepID=A0A6A6PFW3_9PEZI|nr:uncharacterized protein BDY17DRAFT_60487 [Neohortaea acidophila]KAF2478852.1 hypothetical protein BDY17DRAFT_60487 [Neohortaea acidophila]
MFFPSMLVGFVLRDATLASPIALPRSRCYSCGDLPLSDGIANSHGSVKHLNLDTLPNDRRRDDTLLRRLIRGPRIACCTVIDVPFPFCTLARGNRHPGSMIIKRRCTRHAVAIIVQLPCSLSHRRQCSSL